MKFDHAKERRSKRLNHGRDREALQKWFNRRFSVKERKS